MNNHPRAARALSQLGMTVLTLFALSACGGGGDGSSGSTSTSSSGTTSSNGAALLAAYTPSSMAVAGVVANYSGPAFDVGSSAMQANCQIASKTSSTVVVGPDVIVFSANGASLRSQQLALDLFENQAVPQIRTALGLPTTGTAFGGGKVEICVDTALGLSDGETGTSLTGQTALGGSGPVIQIMSADSPNFNARYPAASSYTSPVGQSYATLFVHEGTHAALFSLSEPFGALPVFFQEGMATLVAQQPMGSKSSILAAAQSGDPLSTSNANTNMNLYPTYEATMSYLTSSAAGGAGYGLTNIKTLLSTYVADAMTACSAKIPAGITPAPAETQGMPAGYLNACYAGAGAVDSRLNTAFDLAFSQSFKNADGTPMYLHTGEDPAANALQQTLAARLAAFLP